MDKNTHLNRKREHSIQRQQFDNEMKKAKRRKIEKELDEALESTFPASDATAKY